MKPLKQRVAEIVKDQVRLTADDAIRQKREQLVRQAIDEGFRAGEARQRPIS